MAIAKNPKVIMNDKEFVERLTIIKNRKTFYRNKYPYNLCYINSDGRTSADCVNLVKAILNGYDVRVTRAGYYQRDLSNTGDCTEAELLAQCTDVSTDFNLLSDKPLILYMKGHIGVYLGKTVQGKYNVIECTTSFGGGVVYSWVDSNGTRRKVKGGVISSDRSGRIIRWTHHGLPSKWVSNATGGSNSNEKPKVDYSTYPVLKMVMDKKGNYLTKGEYVKILQKLLLQKGYNPKGIDGIFGKDTLSAVTRFQGSNTDINGKKLVVDGMVGQKTWGSLYK